jgi:copper chaperone CopZ
MMKNTIKFIAACAVLTSASSVFANDVAKITVNGMVCAFCAQGIEKTLTNMPETKSVYVNLEKKLVAVEPKDGKKLDMKKISAGITDTGYDVVKTETLANTTVAAVKAEVTGKK